VKASSYPMGAIVTYADSNATVSDGAMSLVTGWVNGTPLEHEGKLLIPVYSRRDKGREDATVYVPETNIVSVVE
jgi:hypothetical protein